MSVASKTGVPARPSVLDAVAIARGMVRRYDRNGDGKVDLAEVHSGATARGNIDAGIQNLMTQAGKGKSGATAVDIADFLTRTLDTDHDGRIGLWESFGLEQALGEQTVAVTSKTTFNGQRLELQATVPALAPRMDAQPLVFLNYDETLQATELAKTFTAIGQPLEPRGNTFDVSSSHANGNSASRLEVGFRLSNGGKTPLTLRVNTPTLGHLGKPVPQLTADFLRYARRIPGGFQITLPAGAQVDFPAGSVDAHRPGGNPRDGSRMLTYHTTVNVVSGDANALVVRDVGRFPDGGVKDPHMLPPEVSKKHHEGVFLPMRQVSPPVVLVPGAEAALNIAGSQDTHDARYDVTHTFYVALPKGQTPKALVFRGGGGTTQPMVNGRRLPLPVGEIPQALPGGKLATAPNGDLLLKSRQELAVPPADFSKYMTNTGETNPAGDPIYRIDVEFVAGDNGDLGVYARY